MIKHDPTIYDGIEDLGLQVNLQGWNSTHPIFRQLIEQTKPMLIVEVGSWNGPSAIHMARVSAELSDVPPQILCIDTWLGSREIWANDNLAAATARKHGYPQVYFQFLHNVKAAGFADRITPLPMTSTAGARMLQRHGTRPELLYIDGSHEFDDVAADLRGYWPIVEPGGVMFGDDYGFPGVMAAVLGFVAGTVTGIETFHVEANNFWVLKKKAA